MESIHGYLNDRELETIPISNSESLDRITKLFRDKVLYTPLDVDEGIEHIYLSIYYRCTNAITLALKHADEAIKLGHSYACRNKGLILSLIHKWKEASEMFKRSTWSEVKDVLSLVDCLFNQGLLEEAKTIINKVVDSKSFPLIHPKIKPYRHSFYLYQKCVLYNSPEMMDNLLKHFTFEDYTACVALGSRRGIKRFFANQKRTCYSFGSRDLKYLTDNPNPLISREAILDYIQGCSVHEDCASLIEKYIKGCTARDLVRLSQTLRKSYWVGTPNSVYLKMAQERGSSKAYYIVAQETKSYKDYLIAAKKGSVKAFDYLLTLKGLSLLEFFIDCLEDDLLQHWVNRTSMIELINSLGSGHDLSPKFNSLLVKIKFTSEDKVLPLIKSYQSILLTQLSALELHVRYTEKGMGYEEAKTSFLSSPHSVDFKE